MYIYAVIFNCISILDRFNPEWDPLSSKSEACGKASEWQKALHILSWSRRQSVIPGGAGDLGRWGKICWYMYNTVTIAIIIVRINIIRMRMRMMMMMLMIMRGRWRWRWENNSVWSRFWVFRDPHIAWNMHQSVNDYRFFILTSCSDFSPQIGNVQFSCHLMVIFCCTRIKNGNLQNRRCCQSFNDSWLVAAKSKSKRSSLPSGHGKWEFPQNMEAFSSEKSSIIMDFP